MEPTAPQNQTPAQPQPSTPPPPPAPAPPPTPGTVIPGGFVPPAAGQPAANTTIPPQPPLEQPANSYQSGAMPLTGTPSVPAAPSAQLQAVPTGSKSFLATFLLSLWLGVLGADRFYLGKIGTGLLKLVTFGGLGVWAVIDIIFILTNHTKAKDGTALNGYEKSRKTAFTVLIVWLLLCAALATYNVFALKKAVNTFNGSTITCSGNSCTTAKKPSQPKSAAKETPLGAAATADGFSVTVSKVVPDPPIIGDKPDTGMQYIEVDLSITNTTGHEDFVPGSFYYQTSSGKQLATADTSGNQPGDPNKNVQLANRQPLVADTVKPHQTDTSKSLIFQVPQGDKGMVVWRDGILDPQGAKLALFVLN